MSLAKGSCSNVMRTGSKSIDVSTVLTPPSDELAVTTEAVNTTPSTDFREHGVSLYHELL